MVLQIKALLLVIVIGEDILPFPVRMVASAILVSVVEDRGGNGTGARGGCLGTIGRVGIRIWAV